MLFGNLKAFNTSNSNTDINNSLMHSKCLKIPYYSKGSKLVEGVTDKAQN